MKVLYLSGCWFTNVGEAFVDIGGLELTKKIFCGASICCISNMSDYYVKHAPSGKTTKERIKSKLFKRKNIEYPPVNEMYSTFNADYLIIPGYIADTIFLNSRERIIVDFFKKKGAKIIFLGLGGNYSDENVDKFRDYLKELKPELIITRDNVAYDKYHDYCNCMKGIDCALFSIDAYDPRGFSSKDYEVITYNYTKEPEELLKKENAIRAWHMNYFFNKKIVKNNLFISDVPYEYISLYANAKRVYTDLVHASLICLQYGTPVRYSYVDERCRVFDVIDGLEIDENGFMIVKEESMSKQKKLYIKDIRSRLGLDGHTVND